jgi:hypothetical protein
MPIGARDTRPPGSPKGADAGATSSIFTLFTYHNSNIETDALSYTCCFSMRNIAIAEVQEMQRLLPIITCAALVISLPPTAAETRCPMTYEAFEFAIPHLDLEKCPADSARDKAFCRATTGNDAVHVFIFAEDGEQCLLGVKSYRGDEYRLTVK